MKLAQEQHVEILVSLKTLQYIRNHLNKKYYKPLTRTQHKKYYWDAHDHVREHHPEMYEYYTQSRKHKEFVK